VLSYYGARDAGIFRKHGIEVDVDARPFGGFMAGLPTRQVLVGTYAGLNAIEQMNEGKDMIVIGGGLTSMQDVWVRKDSPLKKFGDLKGKKIRVWSRGAGATRTLEALAIDGFKLDLNRDTQTIEIAGPALMALLDKGEVDAMFNLSSLSIAARVAAGQVSFTFQSRRSTGRKRPARRWSGRRRPSLERLDRRGPPARQEPSSTRCTSRGSGCARTRTKPWKSTASLAGVQNAAEAATLKKMLQGGGIFLDKWDPNHRCAVEVSRPGQTSGHHQGRARQRQIRIGLALTKAAPVKLIRPDLLPGLLTAIGLLLLWKAVSLFFLPDLFALAARAFGPHLVDLQHPSAYPIIGKTLERVLAGMMLSMLIGAAVV